MSDQTIDSTFSTGSATRVVHHDTRVINFGDRLFYRVTQAFALIVILLAFLLVFDLFRGAWEAIQTFGLKFLVGTTWDPVKREFSTLPTVIGTLVKAFIALLLAVPISIGSAVFISFYLPKWLRPFISYPIELLAGVPSIVFGLWALFVMVPVIRSLQIWLKANFGWFFLFDGPAVYGVGVLSGSHDHSDYHRCLAGYFTNRAAPADRGHAGLGRDQVGINLAGRFTLRPGRAIRRSHSRSWPSHWRDDGRNHGRWQFFRDDPFTF